MGICLAANLVLARFVRIMQPQTSLGLRTSLANDRSFPLGCKTFMPSPNIPRMKLVGDIGYRRAKPQDEDANGVWANIVMAYENQE